VLARRICGRATRAGNGTVEASQFLLLRRRLGAERWPDPGIGPCSGRRNVMQVPIPMC